LTVRPCQSAIAPFGMLQVYCRKSWQQLMQVISHTGDISPALDSGQCFPNFVFWVDLPSICDYSGSTGIHIRHYRTIRQWPLVTLFLGILPHSVPRRWSLVCPRCLDSNPFSKSNSLAHERDSRRSLPLTRPDLPSLTWFQFQGCLMDILAGSMRSR
jgi:hypothetical protein